MVLFSDPTGGLDWNSLAYMFLAGLITLFIEYLRRKLPPARKNEDEDDPVAE